MRWGFSSLVTRESVHHSLVTATFVSSSGSKVSCCSMLSPRTVWIMISVSAIPYKERTVITIIWIEKCSFLPQLAWGMDISWACLTHLLQLPLGQLGQGDKECQAQNYKESVMSYNEEHLSLHYSNGWIQLESNLKFLVDEPQALSSAFKFLRIHQILPTIMNSVSWCNLGKETYYYQDTQSNICSNRYLEWDMWEWACLHWCIGWMRWKGMGIEIYDWL